MRVDVDWGEWSRQHRARRHAEQAQRERAEAAHRAIELMRQVANEHPAAPTSVTGPGWTQFDQILFARYCEFQEAP